MKKGKRIIVIVLIILFCFNYIYLNSFYQDYRHDCTGDDCPICLSIRLGKEIKNGMQGVNSTPQCFVHFSMALIIVIKVMHKYYNLNITPISLKDILII